MVLFLWRCDAIVVIDGSCREFVNGPQLEHVPRILKFPYLWYTCGRRDRLRDNEFLERILCNRLKIEATIHNAQVMRGLIEEQGSFRSYLHSLDELDDADRRAELSRRFMNLGRKGVDLFLQSVAGGASTGEDRKE